MTVQDMIKQLVDMPMGAEVNAFDADKGAFVPVRVHLWNSTNVEILTSTPIRIDNQDV